MAYRFYGIPSEHDAAQEDKTFGCCRYLWNRMLGDHNTLYSEIGEVQANTPADYKDLDECSWLDDDLQKFANFLKQQEARGNYYSKAMNNTNTQ